MPQPPSSIGGSRTERNGNHDHALADLTRAIELDPNDAAGPHNRGVVYSNKRDWDSAIADFTRAIELNPGYTRAFFYRGFIYKDRGDYDRAIADLTRVVELDPTIGAAHTMLRDARLAAER